MKHALRITILIAMLLPGSLALAQGTVQGTVTDSETGELLAGANVAIVALQLGSSTDVDGRFSITAPAGTYSLQISFVGYRTQRIPITLTSGQTLTQNTALELSLIGSEEIVVLGTRRTDRTIIESAVPIDVITPAEIEATGFTETTQILQMLVPSYNAPQASITDGSDHVRPATLRGLGPDQVLILVNGKRRHTSALVHVNGSVGRGSTGADLNAIPSSAIERIEVLRDGAAAQYGSDAISGVINIVLKERAGFDARVSYGQYASSPTRGYTDSEGLTTGQTADTYSWDGTGIGGPQDVSYSDGKTTNVHLGYGLPIGQGNFYVGGTFAHRDFIDRSGLDPRQQYFSTDADGNLATSGGTPDPREANFDRNNHRLGNGEFDDISLFFNGSMPIGDSDAKAYTFGGVSAREGLSGCFYRRSLDNRTVRSIYPDGFLPKINAKVRDVSGALGVKGNAAGWAYDVSETVGINSFNFDMANTHNASLGDAQTQFDMDAGTLNFLQATTNVDLFRAFEIGTASPLSFAVGGEFRYENYGIDAGEELSYLNGGVTVLDGPNMGASAAPGAQCFPGFQPASQQDESRTNFGLYADTETNITAALSVGAAVRFENYSDFGSTLTGKVAGRFEITDELAVRGALSTGFRAPSLAQAYFTSIATNFIDGVPFEVGTFPATSDVAQALGANELDSEKSLNFSAGVTFNMDDLSISVDAYRININDRITFTENFNDPAVAEFLQSQNINATGGRFFTNAIDTETTGLDIIARYGLRAGEGTVRLTAAVNFNNTDVVNAVTDPSNQFNRFIPSPSQLASLNEPSLAGRNRINDFEGAQPKDKMNFMVNYDLGQFTAMARITRYGEYSVVNSGAPDPSTGINLRDQTFSPSYITDVELGYSFTNNIVFAIGADNLFDVYPDKQIKANSFNGIFPYSGFSPFGFFGRYAYARMAFAL